MGLGRRLTEALAGAPLAPLAIGLIVGIVLESRLNWHGAAYAALAAALLAAWLLLRIRRVGSLARLAVLATLALVLGAWRIGLTRHAIEPNHLSRFLAADGELVDLRGLVQSRPTFQRAGADASDAAFERDPGSSFVLEAEQLRRGVGPWAPVCGLVRISCGGPALQVAPGQRIELAGVLHPLAQPTNPGAADWQRFNRDRRIFALLRLKSERAADPLDAEGEPAVAQTAWTDRPTDWRDFLRVKAHGLLLGEPEPLSADDRLLLDGLILGRRNDEIHRLSQPFLRTGTYHYLAVSGMHIAILAGFWLLVLKLLGVRPRPATLAVLAMVVTYCLMVEPQPPVLRAGLTISLACVGLLLHREVNNVNLLAAAAILLLLIDPGESFAAGFQLSFGIVLGLMLFARPAWRRLLRRVVGEPDVPSRTRTWFDRHPIVERVTTLLLQGLAISTVATVVSLPMIAYYFHRLYPWGIFSSMAVWPFVWLTLALSFAKMLIAALLPTAGAWLNGPLHTASSSLLMVVDWLDRLPGTTVSVCRPTAWAIAVYYGWLVLWKVRPAWLRPGLWLAGGLAAMLAVSLPLRTERDLVLTVLDVGDGSAQAVRAPDGRRFLFDCGSRSAADVADKAVIPFLAAGRTWLAPLRIDAVFLSHPDWDHYSGLGRLAERGLIGQLIQSPSPRPIPPQGTRRQSDPDQTGPRMLASLRVPRRMFSAGTRFDLGGAEAELLWPPEWIARVEEKSNNDASQVIRLRYAGRSILLTGDILAFAQQRLLDGQAAGQVDLHAEVLVLPHHGGPIPTNDPFIRAVNPRHVLVSGRRTVDEVLAHSEALKEPGRHLWTTGQSGAVTVRITPAGRLTVEPFLQPPEE